MAKEGDRSVAEFHPTDHLLGQTGDPYRRDARVNVVRNPAESNAESGWIEQQVLGARIGLVRWRARIAHAAGVERITSVRPKPDFPAGRRREEPVASLLPVSRLVGMAEKRHRKRLPLKGGARRHYLVEVGPFLRPVKRTVDGGHAPSQRGVW